MRLTAFRIQNFRSIVDTGWQSVSPDNITCLIGQNESGKTSVLEGLYVFHSGIITEDVLRSDLSLPEVSCRFAVKKGWLLDMAVNAGPELKELLAETETLELTRYWLADFTSSVRVSGEVSEYLDSLEKAWKLYLDEIRSKITEEIDRLAEDENLVSELSGRRREIELSLKEKGGKGFGRSLFGLKGPGSPEREVKRQNLKSELKDVCGQLEQLGVRMESRVDLITAVAAWEALTGEYEEIEKQLDEVSFKLEERHQMMTLLLKPDDYDDKIWETIIDEFHRLRSERERLMSEIDRQTALCGFLMEGNSGEEAMLKVQEITGKYRSKYTGEMLGRACFDYTPVFTIFEDFGSLLPNRIDLEDIVASDSGIEGYKAARNFMKLAKLDYSFFTQPSSRILKQTIENLNQKLTHNFHDFWQQSVGGKNKIKIQFELEHYSASHGEKSGKPYLEFWIKDEGERLYPKQRSRGVRWFLSFYLELQASALGGDKPIVLLVDEPGVSLHARAQEDVLKVFEDISDKIHIIYTTHSPHLVDINKLHRVLAVQRDDFENYRSATKIIDPVLLSAATPDTLTPIHSVMGNPFGAGFSERKANLIVSDTGSYYFLSSILLLSGVEPAFNTVPATSAESIPSLCNIMIGWGLRFYVLVFDNDEDNKAATFTGSTIYRENSSVSIKFQSPFHAVEDLFSTLDFKKYIVKTREGITVPNSVYLNDKKLPRSFMASRLLSEIKSGIVTAKNFDEESHENFRMLIDKLKELG
ncbi:MAG: AAA family ATPase [Bacteroidales bacterium]